MIYKKQRTSFTLLVEFAQFIMVVWLTLSVTQTVPESKASSQIDKGEIIALSWSPDNSQLAIAYWNSVEVLDVNTRQLTLTYADLYITDVAWSPHHNQIAVSSGLGEASVKIIDSTSGTVILYLESSSPPLGLAVTGVGESVSSIAWSPDGLLLAGGISKYNGAMAERWTQIWDTSTGEIYAARYETSDDLAWSPDGQRLASSRIAGKASIVDLDTEAQIVLNDQDVTGIAWNESGIYVATGNAAGFVNIWDSTSAELLQTFAAGQKINAIAWHPNLYQIASASGTKLNIWDVTIGQNLASLSLDGVANTVAWSPQGNKIAYGEGATVHIENIINIIPSSCNTEIAINDSMALISAITTANNSGDPTTICLAEESTYSFDSAVLEGLNHYDNAIPTIMGNIIIEGNGATLVRNSSTGIPDFRFFTVNKFAHLTLNNLTLENGRFGTSGGAIYSGGTLSLNGVEFTNNYAENGGGAIYNAGTLTINASVFAENGTFYNESGTIQNKGYAGAIYNTAEGVIQVTDTQFMDNQASFGGTIYNRGDLTFTQSSIEGSQSGENAGAVYNDTADAVLSIIDSQFTDNQSRRATGGALVNIGGQVTITGSSFSGNQSHSKLTSPSSGHGGGAIAHYVGASSTGILSVSDSIFTGNSSMMSNGGAILVNGRATVDNSCISGNSNTSVYNILTTSVDFSGNWWGAANGPSGVGSGSGDSVGANIPYTPFLTASTCPLVP